ncbi:MAG TPA: TetR family transcriptional regulator [Kineosporiaceae bacterium]|nr:TetR family transcriptional regulator [Kineosporiaceae bacterium]
MNTGQDEATGQSEPKSPRKAEVTKAKIVDAALSLFAERGFEQTTMRLIADRAGVSVGNAYYYFRSKEDLMQSYYHSLFEAFSTQVRPVLEAETDFVPRLVGAVHTWVDTARPYHAFAASFFRIAADPDSPLSPFSPESKPTRDAMIQVFEQVVSGAKKLRAATEVRERLPELLWLFHMGVVLRWVYDKSPEQAETKLLVAQTAPVIGQLVSLSRLPVVRGSANDLMALLDLLATRP